MKSYRHCAVLLFLLTLLPGHSAVALATKGAKASQALMQEIAAAKRAGFPVSAQDLQRPLPLPEQNAAPVYAQLVQLLTSKPLSEADQAAVDLAGRSSFDAFQIAQIRRALTDRQDVLALIHKAAARPQCVFVLNWSKGFPVSSPPRPSFRSMARWLSVESMLLLQDDKPMEAVRTQALGFQVARHATSVPTLLNYLSAVAIEDIALNGMAQILYTAGSKPKVAETIRQAMAPERIRLDYGAALRGEVGSGLIMIDNLRKDEPANLIHLVPDDPSPSIKTALAAVKDRASLNRFLDRGTVVYLRLVQRVVHAAEQPYPQANAAVQAIIAEMERHENDPLYVVANILLPMYFSMASARNKAHEEVVRSAATVIAWRARHGAFPTRLEAAITPVPSDPFTGKPLGYRREGKGFVVYSVGPTGKFDGGRPVVRPKSSEILFRYPMPAYLKEPSPIAR